MSSNVFAVVYDRPFSMTVADNSIGTVNFVSMADPTPLPKSITVSPIVSPARLARLSSRFSQPATANVTATTNSSHLVM
jgi:Na+-transporting NADH:ubiquinone oxidoreductase subunit NqrA